MQFGLLIYFFGRVRYLTLILSYTKLTKE